MKLTFTVAINEIGDKFVAIPVGDEASKFGGFLKLNESGAFIVSELNNEISYDELVSKCVEKYECDVEEAKKSVDFIVDNLFNAGLLSK